MIFKNFTKVLFCLIFSVLFSGCDFLSLNFTSGDTDFTDFPKNNSADPFENEKTYEKGDKASFYISVKSNLESKDFRADFVLKESGKHCNVWCVEKDSAYMMKNPLSSDVFTQVREKFDEIYPVQIQIFGANKFSDSKWANLLQNYNGKVNILIYDIANDACESQTGGVYGFFHSLDFHTDSNYSNETECINVDSFFFNQENTKEGSFQTLFHEFQHLENFVNKVVLSSNNRSVSTWYNEMLSMLSEDIFTDLLGIALENAPANRLNFFNAYYPLGFYKWRSGSDYSPSGDVYISYANSYAFGAYLLRNFGGIELIKKICQNDFVDEESITKALESLDYDFTFSDVLLNFYQILFENESYSLNKEFSDNLFGCKLNIKAIDLKKFPATEKIPYFVYDNANLYSSKKFPVSAYSFSVYKNPYGYSVNDVQKNENLDYKVISSNSSSYLIKTNATRLDILQENSGYFDLYKVFLEEKESRSLCSEIYPLPENHVKRVEPVFSDKELLLK
ncbi:MAG: hypothetical protein MR456_08380 [Spirochaetia bacterium]|nr:hypothetical protein [Spirochaetia bacterium]